MYDNNMDTVWVTHIQRVVYFINRLRMFIQIYTLINITKEAKFK